MKYYHVSMNVLDIVLVCHVHFWSAYSMAVLLDRSIPTPRQKQDLNVGLVTLQVLAQITYLGCVYGIMMPLLRQLANPLWIPIVTKEKGSYRNRYDTTSATEMMDNTMVILGMVCGSPNLMWKVQCLNRPDIP